MALRGACLVVVALMLALTTAVGAQQGELAALNRQVIQLYEAGNYAETTAVAERAMALAEQFNGAEHPDVVTLLNNLAELYRQQGRYAEAEPLYKRSLSIREKALGAEHRDVALSLNNLALLFERQGRYAEAEPLYKRSLSIYENALGAEHPDVATLLNNLAELYRQQGRYAEAEPLYKRSLSIREKALGAEHRDVALSLNNLALLFERQGRYAEAEPLYKRSLSIYENALGAEHPDVATLLNNLAELYRQQRRYAEAEPLYKRSLSIRENALGAEHPDVALSLNNLFALSFARQDWGEAFAFLERSTGITVRRTQRGGETVGQALIGKEQSKPVQQSLAFSILVKSAHRLAATEKARSEELGLKTFQTAQWAQGSETATSVAQMAARVAKSDDNLARLVRERQALVGEWQAKDQLLIVARSNPPDKRYVASEAAFPDRLAAIDARLDEIDQTLAKDFTDYAALASRAPLRIADVQAQLSESEVLILFLDTPEWIPTPEETFIWAVTKTDSRWVRIDFGTKALAERVAALRCGLDSSNWIDASEWPDTTDDQKQRKQEQIARRERCKNLTGADVTDRVPPPFDVLKARELYQALFGDLADLLKHPDGTGKQLLIVPSGPLTQLPFQVLVTDMPETAIPTNPADYSKVAWLIRRHAVTVLPSVASLKALRQPAKTSQASNPFVGFGNPLLVGRNGTDERAFAKQSCPKEAPKPEPVMFAGWAVPETYANLFRGGTVDVATLRLQPPLPETTDELCAVASELGVTEAEVHLGSRATETAIKKLNTDGILARARVVHFATHGLIASETERVANSLAEPALILTPPDIPSNEDDGLLTASEVTELKLDADWVVLSACNTAQAGEKGNAEALSGLARAFFYAGARALLVSHWYVDSRAAVKLTTGAFAEMKRDPSIGRAEALRRSMLAAMTDTSRPAHWTPAAHPTVWGLFVVVGEGGATLSATPSSPTGLVPETAASFPSEAPPKFPAPLPKSAVTTSSQPESEAAAVPAPIAPPASPVAPVTGAPPAVPPPADPKAATPEATPAPTEGEAGAAVKKKKKPKTARAKKAPRDSDPDWNTKIFGQ